MIRGGFTTSSVAVCAVAADGGVSSSATQLSCRVSVSTWWVRICDQHQRFEAASAIGACCHGCRTMRFSVLGLLTAVPALRLQGALYSRSPTAAAPALTPVPAPSPASAFGADLSAEQPKVRMIGTAHEAPFEKSFSPVLPPSATDDMWAWCGIPPSPASLCPTLRAGLRISAWRCTGRSHCLLQSAG